MQTRLRFLPALLLAALLPAQPARAAEPLPRGFRGIELGMELEAVKGRLTGDPLFDYRGEADVSLLPVPRQVLIECAGTAFLTRAYLQFEEGRLFILMLDLDPKRLDWYTMYTTLSARYGEADSVSPAGAVWSSGEVRLSLERPLTVKYIDRPVFERLQEKGRAQESLQDLSRDRFLQQF